MKVILMQLTCIIHLKDFPHLRVYIFFIVFLNIFKKLSKIYIETKII